MIGLEWGAWRFGWDLLQGLALVGVAVYTWWQNRQRVTRKSINDVREYADERFRVIDTTIQEIYRAVDGRPEFGHFDELRRELSENNMRLGELAARLEATSTLLNRLHEYLLSERETKRR